MRLTIVRIVALALALFLAAACDGGDEVVSSDDPRPSQTSSGAGADGTRYAATGTVLESPQHGPQLCSEVEESYPPQCGGLDIIGWDWDAAPGAESASGTTWGEYTVVGTWDGEALTLTEPPGEPERRGPDDADRFATPCPEPDGGWQVVDPATATDEAMQAAIDHARAQPDIGGVWLDQSINPAAREEPIDEGAMNDPTRVVLNVTFTGDLERHEADLRQRWGGPLCVSEAPASIADLEAIREEVQAEVGERMTYSSVDEVRGRIEIGVHIDDQGFQARFDERYGESVVVVGATLRPVAG
ncbi:MAG TPA: hypothetical protein VFU14_16730 [Acidimicrobiales bacterium]|nr:hypothetical protein [Acidimicrobiales bacterium]